MDRDGKPMSEGGGTLFLASDATRIGPGHFGRVVDYDAPSTVLERFSIHYEADMKRDVGSVLDIRPLSWSADGWPIAGDHPAVSTDAAATTADHLCDSM